MLLLLTWFFVTLHFCRTRSLYQQQQDLMVDRLFILCGQWLNCKAIVRKMDLWVDGHIGVFPGKNCQWRGWERTLKEVDVSFFPPLVPRQLKTSRKSRSPAALVLPPGPVMKAATCHLSPKYFSHLSVSSVDKVIRNFPRWPEGSF